MTLVAWDIKNKKAYSPEREPEHLEYAKYPNGSIKQYQEDLETEPTANIYPITTATITIAGQAAAAFLSGANLANADDVIILTTTLTGGELITYPNSILKLPVVRYADNIPTNDEKYFDATIIDGVLTATGSLPYSGNWKITIDRTNRSLSRINAGWEISGNDIGFIV